MNLRHETSRIFRNERRNKSEKFNGLKANGTNENITELYI